MKFAKITAMTIEKKNKLIYSGELVLIGVAVLVIGVLQLIKVITFSERFQLIFKIITLVGATWMIVDFVWALKSAKHRKSSPILDKVTLLPLAAQLYVFDIIGFAIKPPYEYYQFGVPMVFFYLGVAYIFLGVYHYYKPIPLVLEMIAEEEQAKLEKEKVIDEVKKDE